MLSCKASGVPDVEFEWRIQISPKARNETRIEDFRNQPMQMVNRDKGESVDLPIRLRGGKYDFSNTMESVLRLDNVRTEHYSSLFHCTATNEFGYDTMVYR